MSGPLLHRSCERWHQRRRVASFAACPRWIAAEVLDYKFPFVDRHAILVPERERCQPQSLTEGRHRWAWALMERLAETLPGVGLGYNSLGAYASVNHLHFQRFVRAQPWPVALPDWRHRGGPHPYPGRLRHRLAAARRLQAGERSFNLIYLLGQIYCLPGRRQGEYPLPA